ncbi:helix-turn-helix transcriptional regulator [Chryseobacterium jejuense]|nr:helix-turn-helix transcriptional regulator [Chryseobacterium jejuense]
MKKEKLRLIRKQKGYTQQQVAGCLPTNFSNYSRKESGEIGITKEEWIKIAKFLDVNIEEIYEDEYLKTKPSDATDHEDTAKYIAHLESKNLELKKTIAIIKNLLE